MIDLALDHVANLLLIQGKVLRISNLLVRLKKYLHKTFCALPPTSLGSVAQTTMHENSVPGSDCGSRRDLPRKHIEVRRSPPEIM